jgi:hypothetical protein
MCQRTDHPQTDSGLQLWGIANGQIAYYEELQMARLQYKKLQMARLQYETNELQLIIAVIAINFTQN